MNQFLHLLETLETNLDQIRTDLGDDWPQFAAQVQSVVPDLSADQDETALTRAVGDLYMVCRTREPVMTMLRQTANTSGAGHDRKLAAAGEGQPREALIRAIVNHFQSLLDKLVELERPEKDRQRKATS